MGTTVFDADLPPEAATGPILAMSARDTRVDCAGAGAGVLTGSVMGTTVFDADLPPDAATGPCAAMSARDIRVEVVGTGGAVDPIPTG